jgi:hypothetical protein
MAMIELLADLFYGLVRGLSSGVVAFFAVLMLAVLYRFLTNEKFPVILGLALGLGLLGFTGGLLDIFEQPSFGGAVHILTIMVFVVWGITNGDKIAGKFPKKPKEFLGSIRSGKQYTVVKLPNAHLIHSMTGKPQVSDSLKVELADREFVFSANLPIEELSNRVIRRLMTDWGIGEVDLELDQEGRVLHLAIAATEQGLSDIIPQGFFAVPIECRLIPSNLASGDIVEIRFENGEVIDKIEVKGVNSDQRMITVVADKDLLSKITGSKATLVLALPSKIQIPQLMSVEHRSGLIESFNDQEIVNSLKRAGVKEDLAVEIARQVWDRISKLDPPVSTRVIKAVVIRQLEKASPEAAEKLKSRRRWRFL